jgi:hypothetical protein
VAIGREGGERVHGTSRDLIQVNLYGGWRRAARVRRFGPVSVIWIDLALG